MCLLYDPFRESFRARCEFTHGFTYGLVETTLSKSQGESPLPEYLVYAPYALYLCFAAFSLLNEIFNGIARGFR